MRRPPYLRPVRWCAATGQGQVASGSRLVIAHVRVPPPGRARAGRARAGRARAAWLLERRNEPLRPHPSRPPDPPSTASQTLQSWSWRSWSSSARGGFRPRGRTRPGRRHSSRSRSRSRAAPGAPTRLCCGARRLSTMRRRPSVMLRVEHVAATRWRLRSHASLAPPPPPNVGPRVGEAEAWPPPPPPPPSPPPPRRRGCPPGSPRPRPRAPRSRPAPLRHSLRPPPTPRSVTWRRREQPTQRRGR